MSETFHDLIRQNQRRSWMIIILFTLFVCVVGAAIGGGLATYGGVRDERQLVGVIIVATGIALVIATISGLASYFGGAAAILAVSGAKPIEKEQDPQLFNVVEEMAVAAGLPMPKVYLIDDTAPNAFATGRDPEHAAIAITSGLRGKLSRDELQGVIGHEMSHIRHFDIRFAVLMTTLVGMVALLCDFFMRSMWWGGGRRSSRDSESKGGGLGVILLVVALILAIVAPIVAKLLEMAFSRQREYLADAGAVELTRNPEGLISALGKISADPDVLEAANRATAPLYFVHPIKSFEERASSMLDSHPPVTDRIARLRGLTV